MQIHRNKKINLGHFRLGALPFDDAFCRARYSKLFISHGHLEVEGGVKNPLFLSLFWMVGVARGGGSKWMKREKLFGRLAMPSNKSCWHIPSHCRVNVSRDARPVRWETCKMLQKVRRLGD